MDLISREAVIEQAKASYHVAESMEELGNLYEDCINALPSAFEGMTNGEVLKAIFPDIKVTINEFLGSVVIDGAFGRFITTLEWWLDSYKGVSE